jgi:hypothetical protein
LKDETKMIGSNDSSVYFEYFKAGAGTFLMTTTILSVVISQALYQEVIYGSLIGGSTYI